MVAFIVGVMIGGIFGVFAMCLMVVAGDADRREERYFESVRQQEPPDEELR